MEIWLLVGRLTLRDNPFKSKGSCNLPIKIEESIEYSILEEEKKKMTSTYNRLDFETLGF